MKKNLIYVSMLAASSFFPFGKNALAQKQQDKIDQAKQMLQKTGIRFTENKGQLTDEKGRPMSDVRFTADLAGNQLYLRSTGTSYVFYKRELLKDGEEKNFFFDKEEMNEDEKYHITEAHRMDMELIGANPNAEIIGQEATKDVCNYYLPNCPKGILGVKNYQKVTYKNIYPLIDLVYYIKGEKMEYDFVVHPGGNPANIRMKYTGAESLNLSEDGDLIVKSALGKAKEAAPYSFLEENKEKITSQFQLENGELSFHLANYDQSKTLIIDPIVRLWGTYYSSTGEDKINSVTTDYEGNVIVVGETTSFDGAITPGTAFVGGSKDGFITKFNRYGEIVWSTRFGSDDWDVINAVSVHGNTDDFAQEIIVGGTTSSFDFIVTVNAHQTTFGGGSHDGFIAKFANNGELLWSTYYGGNDVDDINSLIADDFGNVIIGGKTNSTNGIAGTSGFGGASVHQAVLGGGSMDGFIAKFNPFGDFEWGTYYGGSNVDITRSVAVDNQQNIVAVGLTASTNNIAGSLGLPIHKNSPTGFDGFIVKFNTSGVRLWGTFYGGNGYDNLQVVATDNQDNIVAAGNTQSLNGIATPGGWEHDPPYVKDCNNRYCFITKLNPNGTRVWGTYFGGVAAGCRKSENTVHDFIHGLAIDSKNNIIIGGTADGVLVETKELYEAIDDDLIFSDHEEEFNMNGPTAYMEGHKGMFSDGFIVKFNSSGNYIWGTFYGVTHSESILAVAIDYLDDIIAVGYSYEYKSTLFGQDFYDVEQLLNASNGNVVATPGSHQETIGGGLDGFIVKFVNPIKIDFYPTTYCAGNTIAINYFAEFPLLDGNIFTVQLSDVNGDFANAVGMGSVSSTENIGTIIATIPSNTIMGSKYRIRVVSSSFPLIGEPYDLALTILGTPAIESSTSYFTICPNDEIILSVSDVSGCTYQWEKNGMDIPGATSNELLVNNIGDYSVEVTNQCGSKNGNIAHVVHKPSKVCQQGEEAPLNGEDGNYEYHLNNLMDNLVVYPNPNDGKFIVFSNENTLAKILDMHGKVVSELNLKRGKTEINKNLPHGIYTIQIVSDIDVKSIKFIVK